MRGRFVVLLCFAATGTMSLARQAPRRDYTIPVVDISNDIFRQVVVDREAGPTLGSRKPQ